MPYTERRRACYVWRFRFIRDNTKTFLRAHNTLHCIINNNIIMYTVAVYGRARVTVTGRRRRVRKRILLRWPCKGKPGVWCVCFTKTRRNYLYNNHSNNEKIIIIIIITIIGAHGIDVAAAAFTTPVRPRLRYDDDARAIRQRRVSRILKRRAVDCHAPLAWPGLRLRTGYPWSSPETVYVAAQ